MLRPEVKNIFEKKKKKGPPFFSAPVWGSVVQALLLCLRDLYALPGLPLRPSMMLRVVAFTALLASAWGAFACWEVVKKKLSRSLAKGAGYGIHKINIHACQPIAHPSNDMYGDHHVCGL